MMFGAVDYCERLATGSEPLNVATNLAYPLAAWLALRITPRVTPRVTRRRSVTPGVTDATATPATSTTSARVPMLARSRATADPALFVLAGLLALVGLGSAAFHLRPGPLTHVADLLPIGLFVALSLVMLLRRVHGLAGAQSALALVVWALATAVAGGRPDLLTGSLLYFPTVVALATLALTAPRDRTASGGAPAGLGGTRLGSIRPDLSTPRPATARGALTALFIVFCAALLARALDLPLCGPLPRGAHAFWHLGTAIATAIVLLILRRAVVPDMGDRC